MMSEPTTTRKSIEIKEVRNGYLVLLNTHVCNDLGQPVQTFQDQTVAKYPIEVLADVERFLNASLLSPSAVLDTSEDHYVGGPGKDLWTGKPTEPPISEGPERFA